MKVIKFALVTAFLVILGMIIREVLPIAQVSANPVCTEHQPIPSRMTHKPYKCQCMPATENSGQWVPDETCGIAWNPPTPTSVTVINTQVPIPTKVTLTLPVNVPTKVLTKTPAKINVPLPADPKAVPLTGTPVQPCDPCRIEQEKADAEQKKADALGTLAAVEATRLSIELMPAK